MSRHSKVIAQTGTHTHRHTDKQTHRQYENITFPQTRTGKLAKWGSCSGTIHQWRIYIQKFLVRPPQQDQILSFLHVFSPKSTCVGGWCPLQRRFAPPQREILDPPLYMIGAESFTKTLCARYFYDYHP